MHEEPKSNFGAAEASALVAWLREGYQRGRTKPRAWREQQLSNLLLLLHECEDELLDALRADLGKPHYEGWVSELQVLVNEAEYAKKHLRGWMKPESVSTPLYLQPASSRLVAEPLGVVLVIGPWNYPLQLALLPLISAIAAGNAAVVKPSEISDHTSRAIARLVPRYLDEDAVAVVEGGVPETTALLEQRFDHVFYTGNGQVGRIVMTAAAKHLTPVTLELGGKSPVIVERSADIEVAARRIAWGKSLNAGQTCVGPDYALVDRAVFDSFVEHFSGSLCEFFGADPSKSPDYARIINERHFDRLLALLEGQSVLHGGESDRSSRYMAPTLIDSPAPDSPIMSDEIFGPLLPVIPFDRLDEAISLVNQRSKPLALYVFAEDERVCDRVLQETSSGGACINDCIVHLAVTELPFGGVGASGMGAYHGQAGFETFTHRKSVFEKSRHLDSPIRYPPYDERKIRWGRRLI